MVDGNVGRALLEVAHGVPARLHELRNEVIGFAYRAPWIVDEPRLYLLPLRDEPLALVDRELPDGILVDTLLAFGQDGLSARALFTDGAVVLGAKALTQRLGPASAHDVPEHRHHDHDGNHDDNNSLGVHV